MFHRTEESCGAQARRGLVVLAIMSASFLCGCLGSGGSGIKNSFGRGARDTVMLGPRTLDPNETLTPVFVHATRGSEDSRRGLAYMGRGDYERAADAFDRALDMNPDDHNSVFLAGLAYEKLGDQSQACSRYTEAAQMEYRSEYLDGESRACKGGDRG